MFVLLSYDVGEKRNNKIHKTVKKYLVGVHESVFEGEITIKNLNQLKKEIAGIINFEEDSVVIYKDVFNSNLVKEYIGNYKDNCVSVI